MDFNFQQHIPTTFADNSRVWIYQCNRLFFISEALQIEEMLTDFISNWKSHADNVNGYANLFFGQFVVILADERQTTVSGCSTDSSVKLIKEIENKFKVSMFDRQNLAFVVKDKIQTIPLNQLNYAIENKFIDTNTLYFDNTVLTKKELLEKWIVPVNESWISRKIKSSV